MPAPSDEHRRFTRITFTATVTIRAASGQWNCELLDVSLKGMLVSMPPDRQLAIGDPVTVELRLDAGDAGIQVEAVTKHLEPGRAGLQIHHLDMDSAAHLRRLIELNLGDDAQLHRELAAMISTR